MKTLRLILCLIAVVCGMVNASAEARFFKANSVRMKYVWFETEYGPLGSSSEYSKSGLKFAEMWTGNDTIVNDYSCVTLWDQNEGEDSVLIGYVREDENGYVWRYYLDFDKFYDSRSDTESLEHLGIVNDWAFLFDFSNPNWEVGTSYLVGNTLDAKNPLPTTILNLDIITAENGAQIPRIKYRGDIYGIGNPTLPFECKAAHRFIIYQIGVLEYWRDGELLLKNYGLTEEDLAFITKIKHTTISSSSGTEFYDLQGRPADGTKKGIYIRSGKKVLVR